MLEREPHLLELQPEKFLVSQPGLLEQIDKNLKKIEDLIETCTTALNSERWIDEIVRPNDEVKDLDSSSGPTLDGACLAFANLPGVKLAGASAFADTNMVSFKLRNRPVATKFRFFVD